MADRHRRELGFVRRPALRDAIDRGGLLVTCAATGFCHYRRRRDGWSTVYEVVSERRGSGRALLDAVPRPVRLKCPVDLAANGFYQHLGGSLVGVESGPPAGAPGGRRRALNVWTFGACLHGLHA